MRRDRIQEMKFLAAAVECRHIDLDELRASLGELSFHWFWDDATPSWIKGVRTINGREEFAMLANNPAYADKFGVPLKNYLGHPDKAVWESENFTRLDRKAYEGGAPVYGYEHAVTLEGRRMGGPVIKFPLKDETGEVVAIGGRAIGWRVHWFGWQALSYLIKPLIYDKPPQPFLRAGSIAGLHDASHVGLAA